MIRPFNVLWLASPIVCKLVIPVAFVVIWVLSAAVIIAPEPLDVTSDKFSTDISISADPLKATPAIVLLVINVVAVKALPSKPALEGITIPFVKVFCPVMFSIPATETFELVNPVISSLFVVICVLSASVIILPEWVWLLSISFNCVTLCDKSMVSGIIIPWLKVIIPLMSWSTPLLLISPRNRNLSLSIKPTFKAKSVGINEPVWTCVS